MGCPCADRKHPRQQNAANASTSSGVEPETRKPAVDRGYFWRGPQKPAAETPPAETAE